MGRRNPFLQEVAGANMMSMISWADVLSSAIGGMIVLLVNWAVKVLAAAARDEFKKWYEKTADDES